jgi:proteasome beta subunit
MGNIIAHRAMEKVFPADRYSAVAIAGAAGPAVEMVRLFQVQLEHYEKVEGVALSLEGKANQLAQMVRQHLPMAMQGLVVVPLFAGYDTGPGHRPHLQLRRHRRPLRGDRLPGHRLGRPRRPHHHQARLARGPEPRRAVDLAIQALYEAADEDSATGGPDLVRGIYPLIAVVDAEGYRLVPEDEVAERFGALDRRASGGGDAAS